MVNILPHFLGHLFAVCARVCVERGGVRVCPCDLYVRPCVCTGVLCLGVLCVYVVGLRVNVYVVARGVCGGPCVRVLCVLRACFLHRVMSVHVFGCSTPGSSASVWLWALWSAPRGGEEASWPSSPVSGGNLKAVLGRPLLPQLLADLGRPQGQVHPSSSFL